MFEMIDEKYGNLIRTGITYAKPNNLGRGSMDDRQLTKIIILGNEQQIIGGRVTPNGKIIGAA